MLGDLDKLATYAFIGALLTFSLGNSIHAVEPPRTEPVPATKESSDWGAGKWQAEYKLKVRGADLKEEQQRQATWANPLVVAILAAAVAGFSSAAVAVINGHLQRRSKRTSQSSLSGLKKVVRRLCVSLR